MTTSGARCEPEQWTDVCSGEMLAVNAVPQIREPAHLEPRGFCNRMREITWQDQRNASASRCRNRPTSVTTPTVCMSGIDPQTKKFTEPPEQIKKEIAALKADKTVPDAEKKDDLAELEAALKIAKPIQFKENIALVLKYFDKLSPLMEKTPSVAISTWR